MSLRYKANATFADGDVTYKPGDDVIVSDEARALTWQKIGYIIPLSPGAAAQASGGANSNKPRRSKTQGKPV